MVTTRPHRFARARLLGWLVLGTVACALPSAAQAEMFKLTDHQGRSIDADVISVENDIARIRRSDGMRFDLPLANLADADQKALRDWATREEEKPLPANSIQVTASRAKFDSKKTETQVPWVNTSSNGTTTTELRTLVTTQEQWGYSLTVSNTTLRQVDGLRVEYRLYGGSFSASGPGPTPSTIQIGTLKPREKTIVKTSAVTLTKEAYKGENARPVGSQLQGVWVRVYRGNELVHESSTPDSIRTHQTWPARR